MPRSKVELQAELDEANDRVEELEAKLALSFWCV